MTNIASVLPTSTPTIAAIIIKENQAAGIGLTEIPGAGKAGLYLISYYLHVQTEDENEGQINLRLGWSDWKTPRFVDSAPAPLNFSGPDSVIRGTEFIKKDTSPLTYSIDTDTDGIGNATYNLTIVVQRLTEITEINT